MGKASFLSASFLSKIAIAAGVFVAMAFTASCSDDKDDNSGGPPSLSSSSSSSGPSSSSAKQSSSSGGSSSSSSTKSSAVYGDSLTHGGETYPTVVIGRQEWVAKNMNYEIEGSVCYKDNAANCDKYGRLYSWEAAGNACPKGWRLPSDNEWTQLVDFADVDKDESSGVKLKINGTDDYKFSALFGGYFSFGGGFHMAEEEGYWWSSTEHSGDSAYYRNMYSRFANVSKSHDEKSNFYSIRCIKN